MSPTPVLRHPTLKWRWLVQWGKSLESYLYYQITMYYFKLIVNELWSLTYRNNEMTQLIIEYSRKLYSLYLYPNLVIQCWILNIHRSCRDHDLGWSSRERQHCRQTLTYKAQIQIPAYCIFRIADSAIWTRAIWGNMAEVLNNIKTFPRFAFMKRVEMIWFKCGHLLGEIEIAFTEYNVVFLLQLIQLHFRI